MGRTIEFSDEASFLRESGKVFLGELQRDGLSPGAPQAVRSDWQAVANWLGHASGQLSIEQSERLGKAWEAYLAIGLAPSLKLQPAFDLFAEQIGNVQVIDRAPTEIMNVFDRLLATDSEIKVKRAADCKAEEERFRPTFEKLKKQNSPNLWRRQPTIVRNWIFISLVWQVLMMTYAAFFDPFDTGGWDYMSDDESTRLLLVMLAPVGAGAVLFAYRRWVK